MAPGNYPKWMWFVLVACVTLVTVLGWFFGVKALLVVIALAIIGILIVDRDNT